MQDVEITLSRGKLWIGCPPHNWLVDTESRYKRIIKATSYGTPDETKLCLYLRFLGGISSSGILGLTFTGSKDDNLVLNVPVAKEGSSANLVGLTERLAEAVLQEAELAVKSTCRIVSGELNFNYAQLHPIDSNPFIFMLLTRVLISILNTELHLIDRETVDRMVVRNRTSILSRRKS